MNSLRAAWRLFLLTCLVLSILPAGIAARSRAARARWQQRNSRRVLRLLGARAVVAGDPPADGLVVSNHLSYLDALVIAATLPTAFVAKSDVRRWPVIGFLCRLTGTIFVERERRTLVRTPLAEMDAALRAGVMVTLFPEGTSTDGSTVLPFKSSLLEVARTHRATPLAVSYRLVQREASEELCYCRDMTFGPHFWNVLGKPGFVAVLRFGVPRPLGSDRKAAAHGLHAAVASLHRRGRGRPACTPPETGSTPGRVLRRAQDTEASHAGNPSREPAATFA